MIEGLTVDDINVGVSNDGSFTVSIRWSCPSIGFGEFSFGSNNGCGEPFDFLDDECMDKEFIMALFEKVYDRFKGDD